MSAVDLRRGRGSAGESPRPPHRDVAGRRVVVAAVVVVTVVLAVAASVLLVRAAVTHPLGTQAEKRWVFDSVPDPADRSASWLDDFEVLTNGPGPLVTAGRDGGVTRPSATRDNSALYLQRRVPDPVTRIGLTATFPPAGPQGGGLAALLVSAEPMPAAPGDPGAVLPNMGVHFVFGADHWLMAVWRSGGGQEILGEGVFEPPLLGRRSVELSRRADEVAIALPDGTTHRFTDARVQDWSGRYATWELFERYAGTTPAAMSAAWVGWA